MLFVNVTSLTADQGAVPSWLRGVNTMTKPVCASTQQFSKTLPSIRTRCAFFSSKRFLTDQRMAGIGRFGRIPRERLDAMVATKLNIRRNQIRDFGIGAAEHHILTGCLPDSC